MFNTIFGDKLKYLSFQKNDKYRKLLQRSYKMSLQILPYGVDIDGFELLNLMLLEIDEGVCEDENFEKWINQKFKHSNI